MKEEIGFASISLDPKDILLKFSDSKGDKGIVALIYEELVNSSSMDQEGKYAKVTESMFFAGAAAIMQMARYSNATEDEKLHGIVMNAMAQECEQHTDYTILNNIQEDGEVH